LRAPPDDTGPNKCHVFFFATDRHLETRDRRAKIVKNKGRIPRRQTPTQGSQTFRRVMKMMTREPPPTIDQVQTLTHTSGGAVLGDNHLGIGSTAHCTFAVSLSKDMSLIVCIGIDPTTGESK